MRPFVFINSAMSLDGKISNDRKERIKISSEEDFDIVDKLRAKSDAIMVGIGTVLSDNPSLTVKSEDLRRKRLEEGKDANPLRIVVDSKARTPINSKILSKDAKTIVAVTETADMARVEKLRYKAEIVVFGRDRVDLKKLLEYLYDIGVRKLMVEGGSEINYSLIKSGLVDEIRVFYSGIIIGGKLAPSLVSGISFDKPIKAKLKSYEKLGNGIAVTWEIID